jgi:beta-xylosidase
MKIESSILITLLMAWPMTGLLAADQETGKWGDQGDGTYRNPIIAADYSDPDPIRVGSDYYMVASTFELSPGVSLLHSKDLVNWESLGGAIPDVSQLGPDFNWDRMNRYSEGVYAPSLRYHDGKFWVFVNCHSGEGFFCCTATNPAGLWTVTQIKDKNGKPLRTHGWTDPCPLWDDDGKAYLASSRPGGDWYGYLFQMTPDGTQLLDADVDKMNVDKGRYAYPDGGTLYSPFYSTEGNKLFKRNGYYYLQHIEFLDKGRGRGTYILRSKNIYGTKADGTPGQPGDVGTYDFMKFGDDIPGQGGFVDTPDGRWFWIGQINRMDTDGRKPYLLPVTWIDDWPVPGADIQDKNGKMVWQAKKPIDGEAIHLPQGSDEFDTATLNPEWQWNYQPRADGWSLTERPGWLRLRAYQPLQAGNFFKVSDVIEQRYLRSDSVLVETKLDLSGMTDGQEAGLAHFNGGKNYATLGVVQTGAARTIQYREDGSATAGAALPPGATLLWIRSTVAFDELAHFEYSTDGKTFTEFGGPYTLKQGNYRGDMIGLYTVTSHADSGYIDFDYFHYTVQNSPVAPASSP